MTDGRTELTVLAHLLRGAGVEIGTGQVLAAVEAAGATGPSLADRYWAGRTTLVHRPEDLDTYDRVFAAAFGAADVVEEGGARRDGRADAVSATPPTSADVDETDGDPPVGIEASAVEALRHRRFEDATDEELASMRSFMGRLSLDVPERRTRRTEPVRRGRHPDLRRSFQRALQTDGEILHRAWRERRLRPRRLVLVLDVSGSMSGYSRALLQFAFTAARGRGPLEVFCFGTRLTRVTDELGRRSPDRALTAAADRVVDWDGGTRIGASLRSLQRDRRRSGVLRGAVVVICSDGLERGDPAVLRAAMARLSRTAHRIVWVNPLKGDPRYEPVQAGMRVALPFVDRFVSGHDLASLEGVAAAMGERR